MVGGPSIVFTCKAVVEETFIRSSMNVCKSIVGDDAGQLFPHSMCQPMPTGVLLDENMTVKPNTLHHAKLNPTLSRIWFFIFFQKFQPDSRIKSIVTTGRQRIALM